jgi:hypothetical protein
MPRFMVEERQSRVPLPVSLADFYREEFLKYRRCLESQRDCFSPCCIAKVEAALTQMMARLETICHQDDCDEVVSRLLKKLDILTGLSAWSDPKNLH